LAAEGTVLQIHVGQVPALVLLVKRAQAQDDSTEEILDVISGAGGVHAVTSAQAKEQFVRAA